MVEKKPEIVVVFLDDWEGLYINGEIVWQHHQVPLEIVLSALGYTVTYREGKNTEDLQLGSGLPDKLVDVVFEEVTSG